MNSLLSALQVLVSAQSVKNEKKTAFNALKVTDAGWGDARREFHAADEQFEQAAAVVTGELQRLRLSDELLDTLAELGADNLKALRSVLSERGQMALLEERSLDLSELLARVRNTSMVLTALRQLDHLRSTLFSPTFLDDVVTMCPSNVQESAWERAIEIITERRGNLTVGGEPGEQMREVLRRSIEQARLLNERLTNQAVRMITPFVERGSLSTLLDELDHELMGVARELSHRVPKAVQS